jgi:hypothetical protein
MTKLLTMNGFKFKMMKLVIKILNIKLKQKVLLFKIVYLDYLFLVKNKNNLI